VGGTFVHGGDVNRREGRGKREEGRGKRENREEGREGKREEKEKADAKTTMYRARVDTSSLPSSLFPVFPLYR
jgi:hypothetical protein